MAFSRKSMLASVAGSLSLAMLTGCPAANPAATGSTAPTTAPSGTTTSAAPSTGTTSAAPSTTPTSAQPSTAATGSANPTAAPSASAPPPTGKQTIVSGTVYDDAGAPVDAATITVKSLDASVPYQATATTSQGSWVVNSVPEGANVEIVATKDGWTSRRRVGSFQTQANVKNVVDFGGTTDTSGQAYFISKYPEIASVDPAYDATNVDHSTVSYKLTLSEPLDATNQNRFANAIRLFPANTYAAPDNDHFAYTNTAIASNNAGVKDANSADLKDQKISPFSSNIGSLDRPVDVDQTKGTNGYSSASLPNHPVQGVQTAATANVPWDYSIKNGSLFLNDANTRANVTWDATGTVATLTFNAPLIADRTNQARYQVGLVATSSSDRIVDKDNNQLGLSQGGDQNTYPSVGDLIHATVKQPDLSLNAPSGQNNFTWNSTNRWLATHQDAARFAVGVDSLDPKLVSVAYTKNLNQSSRFEFTFNEPMAAYNGRPGGHVGDKLRNGQVIQTISFAVSDRTGGTANVNLKGGTPNYMIAPQRVTSTTMFGATSTSDIEKETWFGYATAGNPGQAWNTAAPTSDPTAGVAPSALFLGQGMYAYGTDINAAETDAANNAHAGDYLWAVSSSNPKTVFLYVVGKTNVFDPRVVEMKVRVEGMPDPAGNAIKGSDADTNQVTSSVQ